MDASLASRFAQLSPRAQHHLPFLGLFKSHVYTLTLAIFVGTRAESHEAYEAVMGETLDINEWNALLEEASAVELCQCLRDYHFVLSPETTEFLKLRLLSIASMDSVDWLNRELVRFYAGLCSFSAEGVGRADRDVLQRIGFEEPNIVQALHLAKAGERWAAVAEISSGLARYYDARGRHADWVAIRERVLEQIGRDVPAFDDSPDKVSLWAFLLMEQANDARESDDLETAEAIYRKILPAVQSRDIPKAPEMVSRVLYELGKTASMAARLEEAEQWHLKAIEITEDQGLDPDTGADHYRELGHITTRQGRKSEAEQWYVKAADAFNRLGLEGYVGLTYRDLASLLVIENRYAEAQQWLLQALSLLKDTEDPSLLADTFGQLGALYADVGDLERAIYWFGSAFERASSHDNSKALQMVIQLAKFRGELGEEQFHAVWRRAFNGQEPPDQLARILEGHPENVDQIVDVYSLGDCQLSRRQECHSPLSPRGLENLVGALPKAVQGNIEAFIISEAITPMPGGIRRLTQVLAHPRNQSIGAMHWVGRDIIILRRQALLELVEANHYAVGMDYRALVQTMYLRGWQTVDINFRSVGDDLASDRDPIQTHHGVTPLESTATDMKCAIIFVV